MPMLERHIEHYGKAPRRMAADGGYASGENLEQAKARQVKDVVFQKKRGLKVEAMAKSPWVYRKLRNFRAGIEAGISCLKRAYGLARCSLDYARPEIAAAGKSRDERNLRRPFVQNSAILGLFSMNAQ